MKCLSYNNIGVSVCLKKKKKWEVEWQWIEERERDLSDSSIWFTWNEMRESNGKVSFGEMREGKSRVNYMRCANEALEKSFIKITMLLFILFLSFLAKNKMKSEILEQQQFSLPIFFKCIN